MPERYLVHMWLSLTWKSAVRRNPWPKIDFPNLPSIVLPAQKYTVKVSNNAVKWRCNSLNRCLDTSICPLEKMCLSRFQFCLCDAAMGGRTSSKTWAAFVMNVALNQYAVFMEMIHQESLTQSSTWMDDVFCSECCHVANTGARLRSGLMFRSCFCKDVMDGTSVGCSPPGKWGPGGRVALFLVPVWAREDPSSAFKRQGDAFSLFCRQHHLWMIRAFVGMKTRGFKSWFALKSTF